MSDQKEQIDALKKQLTLAESTLRKIRDGNGDNGQIINSYFKYKISE